VGIPPQEDAWLGKATERIFLAPIKMTMVPEIVDMDMPVEGVFHNLVITQIRKEYAGQGQKVMNAMWGAGQMMFNKILVLADEGVQIQDYESLAKYIFENLDPQSDIYFSQGPMDVLDHSCSKLGFGGKMCIDGTRKFDEEIRDHRQSASTYAPFNAERIKNLFREIHKLNASLLAKNIPVLIISIEKNRKNHVRELHRQLTDNADLSGIKMILYVEHTVDANDLPLALWRFCNNLDPKRDHILNAQSSVNCVGFDGTRKTKEHDDFTRDWPNIIVADEATINAVDHKWDQLGLGPFIPSPSLKYKEQLYGTEAIVS
jgi:4-hydroxy-3-polyprenylbenzoate decarboxylase